MNKISQIQQIIKLQLLDLHYRSNAGHIGSTLSCIDILISVLLFQKQRDDTFILSKGHAALALYCCLKETGEISDEQFKTIYCDNTIFPAHPAPGSIKGIPFATGSLGHGFPLAAGVAKANKFNKDDSWVYVLLSDGDTNEGTTWETAHFAVKHMLNNLIVIIDKNKIQGFDYSHDVLSDTARHEVWSLIGFDVAEIPDGHDIRQINEAIKTFKESTSSRPKLLIANTIKGKGVSFMENTIDWHYWPMNQAQYNQARDEIKSQYNA